MEGGDPLRHGGGHGEDGNLVERGDLLRRHVGAAERSRLGRDGGGVTESPDVVVQREHHLAPHAPQHVGEAQPGRSLIDLAHVDHALGDHTSGHHEDGGSRGVARYGAHHRAQGGRVDGDHTPLPPELHAEVGARFDQHLLGMGPRGDGLAHRGRSGGREPGQEDGRLDLGARHLGGPVDPVQGATVDAQRRQAARARSLDERSHEAERLGHPVHGTERERCVAHQLGLPCQPGHQPGQQPHGGARVAAVDGPGRRPQPAAPTVQDHGAVGAALDPDAHRLHRRHGGGDIGPVGEPVDHRGPFGQCGQEHRAVRDRLLAGRAHRALAGPAARYEEDARHRHASCSARQR